MLNDKNYNISFKTIDRRVYDVLNVLDYLKIIQKNGHNVRWLGIFKQDFEN